MATLTVRNLEDEVVRRLRIQAAEHGRSAEAEHREILKAALFRDEDPIARRHRVAGLLAEFRKQHETRPSAPVVELLRETRVARMRELLGDEAVDDELF